MQCAEDLHYIWCFRLLPAIICTSTDWLRKGRLWLSHELAEWVNHGRCFRWYLQIIKFNLHRYGPRSRLGNHLHLLDEYVRGNTCLDHCRTNLSGIVIRHHLHDLQDQKRNVSGRRIEDKEVVRFYGRFLKVGFWWKGRLTLSQLHRSHRLLWIIMYTFLGRHVLC